VNVNWLLQCGKISPSLFRGSVELMYMNGPKPTTTKGFLVMVNQLIQYRKDSYFNVEKAVQHAAVRAFS
jgi:hypothetical protein